MEGSSSFPPSMQRLIRELSKLPSIGEKSATRLAYHIINNDRELASSLSGALEAATKNIKFCERCFYFTEGGVDGSAQCSICTNSSRDAALLCVVEKPMDLMAIERVGEYRGQYHVLHGLWAPLKGLGPDSMKLTELMNRIDEGVIKEVILATGSTVEGDATSLYIARQLAEKGIKSTRLAQGMPKGGELEYTDDVTLSRALAGRSTIQSV